jgi:glutamate-1-semialdehyde 2,1-aminomutase
MSTRSLKNSIEVFARAEKTHSAGVSSSTRGRKVGWYPVPPVIERGEGAYLIDVDGNQYIDYLGAHGAVVLGHNPEPVVNAVTRAIQQRGALFALPYDLEYKVSEKLTAYVPSLEKVKFSNSGSEACHYAVRLARAFTGKTKILKFEGHYHGWTDVLHYSYHPALDDAGPDEEPKTVAECPGMVPEFSNSVVAIQWNDPDALVRAVSRYKDELAAIITEPIMGNSGIILPKPGYLELLRQVTRDNKIMLIFDEVITGFRGNVGGAQADLGVIPDITVLAKALGAGFVVSAYGGSDEVMQGLSEETFMHGGTFNSNVVAMAATLANLTEVGTPGFFDKMKQRCWKLSDGIQKIFSGAGVPVFIHRYGSMFTPFFSKTDVFNYRDVVRNVNQKAHSAFHRALIERGVIIYPFYVSRWYISAAHSDTDIQNTLDRVADSVNEVKAAF